MFFDIQQMWCSKEGGLAFSKCPLKEYYHSFNPENFYQIKMATENICKLIVKEGNNGQLQDT